MTKLEQVSVLLLCALVTVSCRPQPEQSQERSDESPDPELFQFTYSNATLLGTNQSVIEDEWTIAGRILERVPLIDG